MENEIFNHYREEVKKIGKAIALLKKQGYTIIDLEGKIINKFDN